MKVLREINGRIQRTDWFALFLACMLCTTANLTAQEVVTAKPKSTKSFDFAISNRDRAALSYKEFAMDPPISIEDIFVHNHTVYLFDGLHKNLKTINLNDNRIGLIELGEKLIPPLSFYKYRNTFVCVQYSPEIVFYDTSFRVIKKQKINLVGPKSITESMLGLTIYWSDDEASISDKKVVPVLIADSSFQFVDSVISLEHLNKNPNFNAHKFKVSEGASSFKRNQRIYPLPVPFHVEYFENKYFDGEYLVYIARNKKIMRVYISQF